MGIIKKTGRKAKDVASLVRKRAIGAVAGSRRIESELAKNHPYMSSLTTAANYNRERSKETGRAILDGNRVLNFHFALDLVGRLKEGHYAELGTYRGMTASLIWERKAPSAKFYCFDTFEGFDERDLTDQRLDMGAESSKFRNTSVEHVQKKVAGGPDDDLVFRVGYFPQTFEGLENERFRFVHIDMDLAKPIEDALETFWPRMVDGGMILVHDYKSARYPMAGETVDAFFAKRGITVWPLSDRLGTSLVIKQPGM